MVSPNMATGQAFGSSYKWRWIPSNMEKYERFKNTLLHGEDWGLGHRYFAIYWIDFGREDGGGHDDDKDTNRLYSPMFENSPVLHAERNLLEHLRLLWSVVMKNKVCSITIFQNASPCNSCSKCYGRQLATMKDEMPRGMDLEITVIFSSFYNVRQPSCIRQQHYHLQDVSEVHSRNNLSELRKLKDAGIGLRTTGYEDWVHLQKALQLPNTYHDQAYKLSARKREDDTLREDLSILLG
ncbi:uncharacterized protein LOC143299719 isoform X1 [Babylonia areolata]|uniref:uncharacterized protein LOC143299719 isoform X1 n=1 Tax=Babylonia areolata TaxID=304850 RepID=UPI003FCFAAB5